MHKKTAFLFWLIFLTYCSKAQTDSIKIQYADSFSIDIPKKKVEHSRYKTIEILDQRIDTTSLGFIAQYKGLTGINYLLVKSKYPLQTQLNVVLDSLNSSLDDNGKLVLQIFKLKFCEYRGLFEKDRFFLFRANLYAVSEKGWVRIDQIDTVLSFNHEKRTTKYFAASGNAIVSFIVRNLIKTPHNVETYFKEYEAVNIDSVEKRDLPLYSTDTFVTGVYTSYISFKNQLPDYTDFSVKVKNGTIKKVERNSHQADDDMDYSFRNVYAVITDNKVYINNDNKYYQLEKRGGDFFFTGNIRMSKDMEFASVMNFAEYLERKSAPLTLLLGGMGPAVFTLGLLVTLTTHVAGLPDDKIFEVKVDYTDGSLIPIKEK